MRVASLSGSWAGMLLAAAAGGLLAPAVSAPPATAQPAPAQPASPKTPRAAVLQPQVPIVLRGKKDHVIQGLQILPGDGKAAAAIALYDCENVTISCCEIGPVEKHAIYAGGCKGLKIVNCWLHDAKGNGLEAYKCADVLVQGNRMERVSTGVYALESTRVQVVGNYVEDVQGPMPRGQLVQFNKVKGEGNAVSQNYGVNYADRSRPEDMINMFQSEGTEKSPILIEKNYLVGDPEKGSENKSKAGSGIMLGDGGGRHQLCRNNVLVGSGQVGIGVCGGSSITVEKNILYGNASNVANVAIYVWNMYKTPDAADIVVRGNLGAWKNAKGGDSSFWQGGGFERVTVEKNEWDAWRYFKANGLPKPPSARPTPPALFGDALVPWKTETTKKPSW
jgi:hypothetical protein